MRYTSVAGVTFLEEHVEKEGENQYSQYTTIVDTSNLEQFSGNMAMEWNKGLYCIPLKYYTFIGTYCQFDIDHDFRQQSSGICILPFEGKASENDDISILQYRMNNSLQYITNEDGNNDDILSFSVPPETERNQM